MFLDNRVRIKRKTAANAENTIASVLLGVPAEKIFLRVFVWVWVYVSNHSIAVDIINVKVIQPAVDDIRPCKG